LKQWFEKLWSEYWFLQVNLFQLLLIFRQEIIGQKRSKISPCENLPTLYTAIMFLFPLINFTFLIILFKIHKKIFWITTFLEVILYLGGVFWIYDSFHLVMNQTLYMFTLTGIGFVIVFIAFFAAIFMNQYHEK
jgi:hypothetical protein